MTLEVGADAPDFTLPDFNKEQVSLSSFKGSKNVLLVFYPFAFSGVCQGELCQVRDDLADFQNDQVQVLGVSVDTPFALKAWAEQQGYTFPLLSDPGREVLTAYGAYGEKQLYGKTVTGVIRSTVVVDAQGRVEQASYGVRAKGHVAKLSRELGLQPH